MLKPFNIYTFRIIFAVIIISGIVIIDTTDVIPTVCAEYSGSILCSSASIDTFVALGIAQAAVRKSASSVESPNSFVKRHIPRGTITSFTAIT